jgi:hypothetical protein
LIEDDYYDLNMKTCCERIPLILGSALAIGALLFFIPLRTSAMKPVLISQEDPDKVQANNDSTSSSDAERTTENDEVAIEKVESSHSRQSAAKEVAWLGVSTEEASEALTSQLDLQAGVGLLVTYVVPDGPAAKAGLKQHDVLVQFDDQSLVHPSQLRKLVRVRKEGDTVKLTFYRAGKRKTASVELGKTKANFGWFDDEGSWNGNVRALTSQLHDLHLDETMKEQMKTMHDQMSTFKIDQRKVQEEIRRSMTQARKALHEALHDATNADSALNPLRKALENLAGSGVIVDDNATVVVRNSRKGAKSLVQTDDSGTIVLVTKPKLHLTAHDKEGNLVFDGEIDTADQRAKVPHDLWSRVEPLVEKLKGSPEDRENSDEKD